MTSAVPIRPGQAAFWEAGEWHETRSSTGMTAIVIESRKLDVGLPEAERSRYQKDARVDELK